jgi:peptidoglycan-associated lipoprotein
MERVFARTALLIVALSLAVILPGCKSAPTAEPPQTTPPAFESPASPAPAEKVDETTGFREAEPQAEPVRETGSSLAERLNAQGALKRVHFDFDKYDLQPEALRTLDGNATRIRENGSLRVRIEGHCDERGTVEYNLALGEKRARAVRDYLVSAGIPAQRLSIISFGKERPADPGHDEDAWATNRRAEFLFVAP